MCKLLYNPIHKNIKMKDNLLKYKINKLLKIKNLKISIKNLRTSMNNIKIKSKGMHRKLWIRNKLNNLNNKCKIMIRNNYLNWQVVI